MQELQLPVPLSSQDKTLAVLVNEAVNQTLSRYQLHAPTQQKLFAFLLELTGGTPLYILLSQEGMDQYHTKVFTDVDHRNFVYSVYAAFAGRYSNNSQDWQALTMLVARAGTVRTDDTTSNVPDVIVDRLYETSEIYDIVSANNWILVLGLIVMFWNSALVSNTSARG